MFRFAPPPAAALLGAPSISAHTLAASFAARVVFACTEEVQTSSRSFLARMIREDGFDGVAYPSSQNPEGLNYVLFDATLQCAFVQVHTYECERVAYTWSDVPLKAAARARSRRQ